MSFYKSPQLNNGETWEAIFGDTWTYTTLFVGWTNTADSTARVALSVTVDEGTTWYSVSNAVPYNFPQFQVETVSALASLATAQPINGIKFEVTAAAGGNTFAVIMTGK